MEILLHSLPGTQNGDFIQGLDWHVEEMQGTIYTVVSCKELIIYVVAYADISTAWSRAKRHPV